MEQPTTDTADHVICNAMELIEFFVTGVNDECLYVAGLEAQKALVHLACAHGDILDQGKLLVEIAIDRP